MIPRSQVLMKNTTKMNQELKWQYDKTIVVFQIRAIKATFITLMMNR